MFGRFGSTTIHNSAFLKARGFLLYFEIFRFNLKTRALGASKIFLLKIQSQNSRLFCLSLTNLVFLLLIVFYFDMSTSSIFYKDLCPVGSQS